MSHIDLRRVDLNLLVVFDMLMSERHVGRAAQRLNVSQSAVSHALGRLRELFGDPLFARHPKGIEPTKRSLALGPQVADVLSRARAVLVSSPAFNPDRPHRFTIGHTDGSIPILIALMNRLRTSAPKVELQVRRVDADGVVAALDRQDLDLALALRLVSRPAARISRVPAYTIRYVCLARTGHPALRRRRLTPEEFAALPHLAISPRGERTNRVDDLLTEAGLRRNTVMSIPHFLAAPLIVASTDLVAIIDEAIARLFAAQVGLATFEVPGRLPPVTIDILTAAVRTEEAALKWLRDQCLDVSRTFGGALKMPPASHERTHQAFIPERVLDTIARARTAPRS
jgi:DNA-binding transcriptional LysR family regulator